VIRVPASDGEHEFEIQRSRFRCSVARVADERSATAFIAAVRREHWSATHNCTAFRLGPTGAVARSSDDGEPAGTAGVPMLEVLVQRDVTDVAVVVTRWFGGTKLGAGGLVRAYGRAVGEALDALGTLRREPFAELRIIAAHAEAGRLDNALRAAGHRVAGIEYGAAAELTVHVADTATAEFGAWLAALTGGAATAEPVGTVYLDVPD
jgi:uncharacterized YigZ family protein